MTNAPEPLVPLNVELRGFSGFMLDVDRLLASELVALGTPEECWAAMMLWCRAWKQSPPGSLPNNDRVLAAFSCSGARWPKVREMAMRGFVLCSDGRFYHRVLADEVLRAWGKRNSYKADQERLRKWRDDRKRSGVNNPQWEALRAKVFKRDGYRCTQCESADDLHCDHVVPLADGGESDMSNLMTLCRSCHSRKTAISDMPSKSRRNGDGNGDEMHFNNSSEGISERVYSTGTGTGTKKEKKEPPLGPPSPKSRAKARTAIDPNWQPDAAGLQFANDRGVRTERELPRFRDYHAAKGNLMADWSAAWRTWCGNAGKFSPSRLNSARPGDDGAVEPTPTNPTGRQTTLMTGFV